MKQKHCVFFSGFWLKPLQNWGFELFFDQLCEIQAYPSLERILKKQKPINQKTMFETKWGHHYVSCILSQTLCFLFFGLLFFVFPLNWDRLGSHTIDHQIAQNLNFGEDFARHHCKTQCFCIFFCMKKHLPGAPVLFHFGLTVIEDIYYQHFSNNTY